MIVIDDTAPEYVCNDGDFFFMVVGLKPVRLLLDQEILRGKTRLLPSRTLVLHNHVSEFIGFNPDYLYTNSMSDVHGPLVSHMTCHVHKARAVDELRGKTPIVHV